jgi:hypothetical protein
MIPKRGYRFSEKIMLQAYLERHAGSNKGMSLWHSRHPRSALRLDEAALLTSVLLGKLPDDEQQVAKLVQHGNALEQFRHIRSGIPEAAAEWEHHRNRPTCNLVK